MKKVIKAAILFFLVIIIPITFIPTNLFANSVDFGFDQFSDSPDEPSFFILWADNCSGLNYEFLVTQNSTEIYKETGTIDNDQWYKLIDLNLTFGDTYDLKLTVNGYNPYTSNLNVIDWHGFTELSVNAGTACSNTLFNMGCNNWAKDTWRFSILEYIGSGEWDLIYSNSGLVDSDSFTHNESSLLPEGLYYASFSVRTAYDREVFYVKSCDKSDSSEETEPVWVRTQEMTCKQVWINEDNKFQFSFIYPYRGNNWVKIYDMSGKEVYSIDMPYDNPNIIVDLPDGMYTVKTFNDQPEPIQTFVIGKP